MYLLTRKNTQQWDRLPDKVCLHHELRINHIEKVIQIHRANQLLLGMSYVVTRTR